MRTGICSVNEITAQVRALLRKYHADRAILFGSYARDDAQEQSDIDLVIVGGEQFEPTDVFCIADDLYNAFGKNVDVYEISEINPGTDFYNAILLEGVQIE